MGELIKYKASNTCRRFHKSDAFVRSIIGPIGSGKSVACTVEVFRKICRQKPYRGVRKSRWVIIRNTYRELIDTTMKTFFDWVPERLGIFLKMDMQFNMKFKLLDGTIVEAEVLFRALDKPKDIKKLLSLELTGGWINECREVPLQVHDMLQGRVGRYPKKSQGGPSWWGVISDTNPPDNDHWYYTTFEEQAPFLEGFECFHQPSGTSEEAENLENLPAHYYTRMAVGKDQEWINVYIHGQYGFISDGKPIMPEYKDHLHYDPDLILTPTSGKRLSEVGTPLLVGLDFGLTPASTLAYKDAFGGIRCVDEICTFDMGQVSFSKLLKTKLLNPEFRPFTEKDLLEIWGDPAGEARAQTDEETPFGILLKNGIQAYPTFTNDFTIRRESVASLLNTLGPDGKPLLTLGPRCRLLRKALTGGYKFRRMQISGEDRFQDRPDKNRYSHVAESLQYLVIGAYGESMVLGGYDTGKIDYSQLNKAII